MVLLRPESWVRQRAYYRTKLKREAGLAVLHLERVARREGSPLRDVAGMLRSFDYARAVGLQRAQTRSPEVSEETDRQRALDLFQIEKALYELRYEVDNRPLWLGVPAQGLLRLVSGE